ncbi:MAG: hypothetical protein ACKVWV_01410 [Planctomycetota bacterium]
MKTPLVLASCCVASWCSNALAGVIVVGPGQPFTDLRAAVDAAEDGDTVLVKPGTYNGFRLLGKSLTVVGDLGGVIQLTEGVRIIGLGRGQTAVLANLQVDGDGANQNALLRYGLYLSDDVGSVRVQDSRFTGRGADLFPISSGYHFGTDGVSALDCADVALANCNLFGAPVNVLSSSCGPLDCGSGLFARTANLALSGCTLLGGSDTFIGPLLGLDGADAGDGARLRESSFLAALHSTLTGGFGGAATEGPEPYCPGCGGYGGRGVSLASESHPAESSAVLVSSTTFGGSDGYCGGMNLFVMSPSISHPSSATVIGGTPHSIGSASLIRETQPFDVTLTGAPGDRVKLFVCDAATFDYRPEWNGVLLVDRSQSAMPVVAAQPPLTPLLRVWKGYVLPSSGTLTVTLPTPSITPSEGARTLHVQALFTNPSGQSFLSGHRCAIVLDASY